MTDTWTTRRSESITRNWTAFGRQGTARPTGFVFEEFRTWCEENGHKNILTHGRFSREVCQRLGMDTVLVRHADWGGKPARCFLKRPA